MVEAVESIVIVFILSCLDNWWKIKGVAFDISRRHNHISHLLTLALQIFLFAVVSETKVWEGGDYFILPYWVPYLYTILVCWNIPGCSESKTKIKNKEKKENEQMCLAMSGGEPEFISYLGKKK